MIVTDGRYTVAHFDQAGRKFLSTYGRYTTSGGKLSEKLDFNTFDSTEVGQTNSFNFQTKGGTLKLTGTRGGTKVAETEGG